MSLEDLRKQIDQTDAQIVKLISERMKIASEIGKDKNEHGKQIEDKAREELVLKNIGEIARNENINQQDIEDIYRKIIITSKKVQGNRVAFQGELGAYSEEATSHFFQPPLQLKPCESFDDVFTAVEKDEADFGTVPVENSLEGSVSRVYDLLLESSLMVCGEIELRVSHCLITHPETSLDSIKRVYSHPQALGQCRGFLKYLDRALVPSYDTAGSVKMLKEQQIKDGAAIASARTAEIYGMKILNREIEDNPHNFTRFFILSKEDASPSGNDKTSIVFSVKDKPGTLYSSLKIFNDRNLNLSKIESRPTRQKPWQYNFYLDFKGHRQDKEAQKTLVELEKISLFVKILGSYPKSI